MKKNKVLFYILIYTILVGGIMGIIKVFIPHMEWFGFRQIIGMGNTFKENTIPTYAVAYGAFMAILEIISSILLLTKNKIGIMFAIVILSINAFGCIIAVVLGDLLATGSLLIRVFAIYFLIKCKSLYPKFEKEISIINL